MVAPLQWYVRGTLGPFAAGAWHTLVGMEAQPAGQNPIFGFGQNTYGQLGNGTTATIQQTPVQVSNLQAAVSLAGGGAHSLAVVP
jgi:alpha-tubulin suppressor-like RCC1 family protein